jgi:hypothetical protein
MAINYLGKHRKYVEGTSTYTVYVRGDIVERNGVSYVCDAKTTSGYIPEDANSGFLVIGGGTAGGGTVNFTFSPTAPTSPSAGDQWLDSLSGILYVYVVDEDSGQWIQPNAGSSVIDGGTY